MQTQVRRWTDKRVKMKNLILFILCVFVYFVNSAPNAQRTPSGDYSVTHLDIRDAVLSLVRVLQDQMDKLERHEVRERQLGEQLTRSLGTLEKRSRGGEKNIENIAGYIAKIDEKVGKVEKESEARRAESERTQSEFQKLHALILGKGSVSEDLNVKLDGISQMLKNMTTTSSSLTPETLSHITELLKSSPDDSILQELSEMKEILTRASEPSSTSVVPEWQADLLDSMDSQRKQIALLEEEITRAVHVLGDITKSASNLDESVGRLGDRTDTGFNELNSKLENSQLEGMVKEGGEKVGQVEEAVKALQVKVESGYDKLAKEMKGLSNVESVLLDTGDSVLDTKRRLEYGVQQILGELNSQIKESTRTLNGSLQGRFDSLATAVLGNQTKSLTNLTARMEEEISQVWRQIGILYHQMSRSANLLDDIHSQTSKYVNNSLDTMTSMDGKVGQITNRMGEVDDNLNYLLGRMSLVVQEFNMIKNGLGDALVGLKEGLEGQTGGEGGGEGVGENAIQ